MVFELELFFNLVFKTAIGMSIGPTVKELEPFSRPPQPISKNYSGVGSPISLTFDSNHSHLFNVQLRTISVHSSQLRCCLAKKSSRVDLGCQVIFKEKLRDIQPRSPCFVIMAGVGIAIIILHVLPQKCMKYILLDIRLLYYEKSVTIAFC